MKFRFAFLALAACLAVISARASDSTINLNSQSNLKDMGIAPAEQPPTTILDGVPLMPGLQPKTDDVVKIIPDSWGDGGAQPTVAVGIVDVDEVYNFYKIALPHAGWQSLGARDYKKGNVTLHINAQADGKLSTVTYTETRLAQ